MHGPVSRCATAALSEHNLLKAMEQTAKDLLACDPDELLSQVSQRNGRYTGLGYALRTWDSAEPNGWEADESLVTVDARG